MGMAQPEHALGARRAVNLQEGSSEVLQTSEDIALRIHEARHTSLTRLGCSGCDAWTLARIAGHQKIQMSMTYVHSQYMEGAGWWGQWWESRKSGGTPKAPAAGAGIRYTENLGNGTGERRAVTTM